MKIKIIAQLCVCKRYVIAHIQMSSSCGSTKSHYYYCCFIVKSWKGQPLKINDPFLNKQ